MSRTAELVPLQERAHALAVLTFVLAPASMQSRFVSKFGYLTGTCSIPT